MTDNPASEIAERLIERAKADEEAGSEPYTANLLREAAAEVERLRAGINSFLAEFIVAHDTDASIRTLEHAAETLARTVTRPAND